MARDNRIDKYAGRKVEPVEPIETGMDEEEIQLFNKQLSDMVAIPWEKQKKKVKMEDSHMRTSFLFRRDLKARLDVLSDIEGRGYRTKFLNQAIHAMLIAEETRLGINPPRPQ